MIVIDQGERGKTRFCGYQEPHSTMAPFTSSAIFIWENFGFPARKTEVCECHFIPVWRCCWYAFVSVIYHHLWRMSSRCAPYCNPNWTAITLQWDKQEGECMSWIYKGTVCNIYVAINCVYPSNYGNHANPTDIQFSQMTLKLCSFGKSNLKSSRFIKIQPGVFTTVNFISLNLLTLVNPISILLALCV